MAHEELPHLEPIPEEPDEWHHHTAEEGEPGAEHAPRVNVGLVAFVFVLIVLGTLGTVLALTVYFRHTTAVLQRTVVETTAVAAEANRYRAQVQAELAGSPEWVDRERGLVRVPIDLAMERVVDLYRSGWTGGAGAR